MAVKTTGRAGNMIDIKCDADDIDDVIGRDLDVRVVVENKETNEDAIFFFSVGIKDGKLKARLSRREKIGDKAVVRILSGLMEPVKLIEGVDDRP